MNIRELFDQVFCYDWALDIVEQHVEDTIGAFPEKEAELLEYLRFVKDLDPEEFKKRVFETYALLWDEDITTEECATYHLHEVVTLMVRNDINDILGRDYWNTRDLWEAWDEYCGGGKNGE